MSITSEMRRLNLPGLLPADPAREKYWVRPGGVTVFMLNPDDRMTLDRRRRRPDRRDHRLECRRQ